MRLLTVKLLALCLSAALVGCAKFPDEGAPGDTKRLVFTLEFEGEVSDFYLYHVVIFPSPELNPTDQGPVPVIGPPWGNGFVAGNVRYFIRWTPTQSPQFIIYRFEGDDLINFREVGVPINFVIVPPNDPQNPNQVERRFLRFEIDLDQIAETPAEADAYRSLLVNVISVENLGGGTQQRAWDALGNSALPSGVNQWVRIPLNLSRTFRNQDFAGLEPRGDVADPALDLIDWAIEVRLR
ncbi:MAG TPA: hypothetical protein VM328_13595 [Fimbriimonadaceae bacterium]|nr:hypothetical protein [Fimbriimonadaceae bacterium]